MKAQDLRIGDLVQILDEHGDIKTCKVVGIDSEKCRNTKTRGFLQGGAKLRPLDLEEDEPSDWYWVGDKPGGTCDFDDTDFLTPEEMVLILEHRLNYDDYAEWRDANTDNIDRKGFINLQSWIMGCRHDMLPDKKKQE